MAKEQKNQNIEKDIDVEKLVNDSDIQTLEIDITKIDRNPNQPRKVFNEEALKHPLYSPYQLLSR